MDWSKLLNDNRFRQTTRSNPVDNRNDFESDFGRIIFSAAMRRMHDKTQVFPLTTDDNIHSRLTHSMEVMAIGYSLGLRICKDKKFQKIVGKTSDDLFREIPVLLKNASLVHDIGNPPFGHFGETVIQTYFKNIFDAADIEFEENEKRANEKNLSFKLKKKFNITQKQREDFECFDGKASNPK